MSKWLYQFWSYGFKTAKCWGRGPREWNASNLGLTIDYGTSPKPYPGTPRPGLQARLSSSTRDTFPRPSPLCRWSIHYEEVIHYQPCKSRTPSPEPNPDPFNEGTWKPWPSSWETPPCQEKLLSSLSTNSFSTIGADTLPIAIPKLIGDSTLSPNELLEEALGFSIMARNTDLLCKLMLQLSKLPHVIDKFRGLNPIHLATTYLDGSRTCCTMLSDLLIVPYPSLNFRLSSVNNLGHTVLDNLMIAILKAHTSIAPGAVDDSLRSEAHFPGEEVDICGRWDADSECVRARLAAGHLSIPFAWKHKFCHTSIQAICDFVDVLSDYDNSISDSVIFATPSGLFMKRCVSCGLKMVLQPLHAAVMTAFALAEFGTEDEDLFGMLAVLLCMLKRGADPFEPADISTLALFPEGSSEIHTLTGCNHKELTPAELANLVPSGLIDNWPVRIQTGWSVFCHVLKRSERDWEAFEEMPLHRTCDSHDYMPTFFGDESYLGVIEAAVRTEILTYRRLEEGDTWVSPHFDMGALLDSLDHGGQIAVGLVDKGMMNPLCECGEMKNNLQCSTAAEAMTRYYFSNMGDWSRSTYIGPCLYPSEAC